MTATTSTATVNRCMMPLSYSIVATVRAHHLTNLADHLGTFATVELLAIAGIQSQETATPTP